MYTVSNGSKEAEGSHKEVVCSTKHNRLHGAGSRFLVPLWGSYPFTADTNLLFTEIMKRDTVVYIFMNYAINKANEL
jgi:hypothetical protein